MFGNAPRAVWQKWCPPDERGRISLACRAMLVEEGNRKVLFETGIGAFFPPELKARYGVEDGHRLLDALAAEGLTHATAVAVLAANYVASRLED